ncbi:hypothetical protein Asulf_00369 [Archaeoglobus sulfaticallidus PM70-1]|uniref:NurA domain-containing protein n=1 Tax=Archaeoglobus sulfaticallidus PM70-1 TaxID=387631 RepID=N0BBL4_9EURY|nr:DNA double-strand break repair nuclease NurA [Archaeoglobus sulfaticallidus]AGK60398.1 hypothetical protein Asulf_00369 [Archaeoglobus sulfaticallidus PM70-1]
MPFDRVLNSRVIETVYEVKRFLDSESYEDVKPEIERLRVEVDSENWKFEVLRDVRVVGVDGSQLRYLKEFGVPFGAVQVAKLILIHGKGEYRVDYRTKWVESDKSLDLERFELELKTMLEELESDILFFDGSFSVSFANQYRKDIRDRYFQLISEFLEKSKNRAFVVGFIDRSYSKDLFRPYDSFILKNYLRNFEYTEPMPCTELNDVFFSYLKIGNSVVRVEFPKWMAGMHDVFMRYVVAECLLGSTRQYPYVLERAHMYAVISEREREIIGKMIGREISYKWMAKYLRR